MDIELLAWWIIKIAAVVIAVISLILQRRSVSSLLSTRRKQFISALLQHATIKNKYKSLENAIWEYITPKPKIKKPSKTFCLNISPIVIMIIVMSCLYLKSKNFHVSFFTGYLIAVMMEIGLLLDMSPFVSSVIDTLAGSPKKNTHVPLRSLVGSGWSVLILLLMFPVELWTSSSLNIKSRGSLNEFLFYMIIWILPFIMYILFLRITNKATRDLWKIAIASKKVGEKFARDLPHLIVKTKNGNIFFGQLYDPLDDKTIILRKAKLVFHNGRELKDQLEKVLSHAVSPKNQENYISIPWDNIETLQIVEKGLYMKHEPETDVGTNNKDGTRDGKKQKDARETSK